MEKIFPITLKLYQISKEHVIVCDTILMLFQNQQNCDKSASISKMENQCQS